MIDAQKVKELFVNIMELEDYIPEEDDDVMGLKEFTECVKNHFFMDYDGFGYVLYKDIDGSIKEISNACLWVDEQMVFLTDETDNVIAFNLYILQDMFGDNIKINWFNK